MTAMAWHDACTAARHQTSPHGDPLYPPEDDEYARCADCGTEICLFDRAFPLGSRSALCFDCACERDGIYEQWLDRWTVWPRLDGLATPPGSEDG
jgi:hypothetical protein